MHARASAAYVKWKTHRSDLDAHENERTKRRQKRRRGLSDLSGGGGGGTVFVIVIVGRSKGVSLSRLGWSVGPLPSQVTSQAVQREARPTTEATMASSGQHSILHPSIHPYIRPSVYRRRGRPLICRPVRKKENIGPLQFEIALSLATTDGALAIGLRC